MRAWLLQEENLEAEEISEDDLLQVALLSCRTYDWTTVHSWLYDHNYAFRMVSLIWIDQYGHAKQLFQVLVQKR